jgi:hypothetical protein
MVTGQAAEESEGRTVSVRAGCGSTWILGSDIVLDATRVLRSL